MKPFTVAVDFDGTIAIKAKKGPAIMGIVPGAKEAIATMQAMGIQCFLWTCRGGHRDWLDGCRDWLIAQGIYLDMPMSRGGAGPAFCEKAKAHLYIDDKALGAPLRYLIDLGVVIPESDQLCIDWKEALIEVSRQHRLWQEEQVRERMKEGT